MSGEKPQSKGGIGLNNNVSRRTFLRSTAATGALAVGLGSGIIGDAAAGIASFDNLSVSSDNRIVNESGETFKMRGLNIPDPKRLAVTKHVRGKTPGQLIDLITNNKNGWYPRVIRIPAQPTDIGEHPNGNTGPTYGSDSPQEIPNDRHKHLPPQPPAFTQSQLDSYLKNYYDPVVQQCKERGVYCIVDFHRHWHEQPPGDGQGGDGPSGDAAAENHLPFNSEYTLYWAHNTYYGKDTPSSWGWVDQTYRNNNGYLSEGDIQNMDTPYDKWEVNQALVDETLMFWDTVAQRYADEPHVIFEPYNEPTAPGIWGPVSGCGAFKQEPLWDVFLEDFAAPIMNKVREYAPEKLILMGLPGWCQATQALHWRTFNDVGIDNVAAVWHNYGGHAVSQVEHWLNDTNYEYMTVPNPYLDQAPENPYDPSCWGWEPYEAQGIQNAMDFHPVVASEFGWIDDTSVSRWLHGSTTGQGTTQEYGKPVIDALETDDRISWVAWCADARWMPAMFKVDFPLEENSLGLVNGSWYETPDSQLPDNCPNLPCDWTLMGNPNMGQHVKQRLAEHRDDGVPFEMQEVGAGNNDGGNGDGENNGGSGSPNWPEGVTDPDGDGIYEDINANGETDFDDLVAYFNNMDNQEMQANSEYYDLNGNGEIDYADLVKMFEETA
jgi:PKD repeat protein